MLNELWKMTAHQVKEGNFTKAILAIGSCEAHGQHVAEGCDTLVSYRLSKQIADQIEGLLVLPPITVGYSAHYDSFPFSLTLSYDTITSVIYDMVESVIRNGITHIILMNGHDGNIAPIEIASRKIKEAYPEVQIASLTQWWVTGMVWVTPAKEKLLSLTICSPNGASPSMLPASSPAFRKNWKSNGISQSLQIPRKPETPQKQLLKKAKR